MHVTLANSCTDLNDIISSITATPTYSNAAFAAEHLKVDVGASKVWSSIGPNGKIVVHFGQLGQVPSTKYCTGEDVPALTCGRKPNSICPVLRSCQPVIRAVRS